MMRTILFISFLSLIYARTSIYQTYKSLNKTFHDSRTFGSDNYVNPALIISQNILFRTAMNTKYTCNGALCDDISKFNCKTSGAKDCYHVDHIIDVDGPEFEACKRCKNVGGNLVMADGRWNSALGGLAMRSAVDYYTAQDEKLEVYGIDKIGSAMGAIASCCSVNYKINYQISYSPNTRPVPILLSDDTSCIETDFYLRKQCICSQYSNFSYGNNNYVDYLCSSEDKCSCDADSIYDYCCDCDCNMDLPRDAAVYINELYPTYTTTEQSYLLAFVLCFIVDLFLVIASIIFCVKYRKMQKALHLNNTKMLRSSVIEDGSSYGTVKYNSNPYGTVNSKTVQFGSVKSKTGGTQISENPRVIVAENIIREEGEQHGDVIFVEEDHKGSIRTKGLATVKREQHEGRPTIQQIEMAILEGEEESTEPKSTDE